MKTFVASLIVFSLLVTLIATNYFYINRTANELSEMIATLPDCEEAEAATEALLAYWNREEGYLGLSVPFEELQQAKDVLLSLHHAAKKKNAFEFEKHRLLAEDAIDDLRRLERFKLDNLL